MLITLNIWGENEMSELILWKDKEMNRLRKDMDRLFKDCWSDAGLSMFFEKTSENIHIETMLTKDAFIVEARVKEMAREDLEVILSNDKLIIKGSTKKQTAAEKSSSWLEARCVNAFVRTIALPFRIEISEVKAVMRNDLLKIRLPRWRPEKIHLIAIEIQ